METTGVEPMKNYKVYKAWKSHSFKFLNKLVLTNQAKCLKYFKSKTATGDCLIKYNGKIDLGENEENIKTFANPSASLNMRAFAIIFKARKQSSSKDHVVFVRGETPSDQPKSEKLSTGNYFGLYYTRVPNWQVALKLDKAVLVLKGPSFKTFNSKMMPKFEKSWDPFNDFISKLILSSDPKTRLENISVLRTPPFRVVYFTGEFEISVPSEMFLGV